MAVALMKSCLRCLNDPKQLFKTASELVNDACKAFGCSLRNDLVECVKQRRVIAESASA